MSIRWLAWAGLLLVGCYLSACSTLIENRPGVTLRCMAQGCPTEEQVQYIADRFSEMEPGFSSQEPLLVDWVEPNDIYIGRTATRRHVLITTLGVLPHELYHVMYWRLGGNPDRDHEQGTGPLTEETH